MGYFSPSSQFIQQYIYERRGDPGYNDEKAHEVLWNYLLRTSDSDDPDGKKVRDAVRDKEWDTVETELDNLINKIKTDTDHPLHLLLHRVEKLKNLNLVGLEIQKVREELI
jgi:hypothetical protein